MIFGNKRLFRNDSNYRMINRIYVRDVNGKGAVAYQRDESVSKVGNDSNCYQSLLLLSVTLSCYPNVEWRLRPAASHGDVSRSKSYLLGW